jgi:hypothetical protein
LVPWRCLSFTGTPGVDLAVDVVDVPQGFSDPDQIFTPEDITLYLSAGIWYSLSGCINLPYLCLFDGDDTITVSQEQGFTTTEWVYDSVNNHYTGTREFEGTVSLVTTFGQIDIEFTGTLDNPTEGIFESEVVTTYGTWSGIGGFPMIGVFRRAAKVWEAFVPLTFLENGDVDLSGNGYSLCLILPDRFETTGYEIDLTDPGPYRTYHPVTQELLGAESPVCFM